jgi:hypothetical protein
MIPHWTWVGWQFDHPLSTQATVTAALRSPSSCGVFRLFSGLARSRQCSRHRTLSSLPHTVIDCRILT